jgi:hypothetical protein
MATTIKVVKKDEIVLSSDERKILYDKIGKESQFDKYHFPIFSNQDDQIVEDSVKQTIPTILTILGRRVLKHSLIYPLYNSSFSVKEVKYNDLRKADIKKDEDEEINEDAIEKISVGIDVKVYGGDQHVKSPKLPPTKHKNPQKPVINKKASEEIKKKEGFLDIAKNLNDPTNKRGYGFDVEFDEPVHTIVDGQIIQIAAGQKINVGGYAIRPHPVISTYIQHMTKHEIGMGIYKYKDIAINDLYSDVPIITERIVVFNDETEALKELRLLFHFIKWYDQYIENSNVDFLWDVRLAHSGGKSFHQKNIADAIKIPSKGKPISIPPEKLSPLLLQFLKRISAIYEINQYSYNQVMVDLIEFSLFNMWEHAFLTGFDSSFDDQMEILKKEQIRSQTVLINQKSKNERYVKNMTLVHIIKEKYGQDKVKTIDVNKDVLSQLKKPERDFIESEYVKREKTSKKRHENECEHIHHVENIRTMTQRDSMIAEYNLLKPFIGKKKDDKEFPLCKVCEYPLICGHIIEEIELNIAKMSPKAIREKMLKYIGDASIEDKYFCKHCGEHILDVLQIEVNDFMEENMPGYGEHQIDSLKSIIWNEISYLVYNRINFQNIYSVKNLIQHIADNIYEFVYDVEKKLNKAKTNTPDMIEERVRLYTIIYGLSNLINLIKNNSGKLWFAESKSTKQQKAGKIDLGTLFTQAMKILVDSKNISIRKFNISNPNLLIFLKKAYLSLVGTSWIEKIPTTQTWIPSDPFFKYIVRTCEIFADSKAGYNKEQITTYFTKTEKELKSGIGLYEYVKSPFKSSPKNIPKEVNDELFRIYWQMNFEQMFVSINNGVYKESRYQGKYNDRQVATDRSIVPLERLIFDYYRIIQSPVFFQFPLVNTRKYCDIVINMADIYDVNGKKHKWGIYVFSVGNKKMELTKKDVAAMIGSENYEKMELIDYKCTVCSQYASKATGKNIEGILDELDKIQNFFRYFEYRCPIGEVHEWSTGDSNEVIICKHCHISKKKYQENDESYYNKHVSKYDKRTSDVKYSEPIVPKEKDVTSFVNKWNFNTNIITELAKVSDKKYNVLANLGFTEGIEYDHIVSGAANPSLKLKPSKYHMNRISGYINLLIREYNILKSRSFVKTVPTAIKAMIKDYQFKPEELPAILVEYEEHINEFDRNVKKGFYFVMDSLYKTIYLMYKSPKNSVLKVFGEYIFEKIILTDMLFSKPREAYLGLISDKDADADIQYESDPDDDPSDEVEGFDYSPDEGEEEDQEYQGEY